MKKIALGLAALMLPMAANAQVTIAGTATPSVHSSDPGLVLTSAPGNFSLSLDLDPLTATPNSLFVSNLFTLGTTEGSVNIGEDTVSYPLSVEFAFTNPLGTASDTITGQSFGFYQLLTSCGLIAGGCGRVVWDGPQTFNFGAGGSFSLALNNVTFGTPGSSAVGGTFTLLSTTAAVPEPATWAMMLLGFGGIGYSMRRRRKPEQALATA
ncbi:PEPxxWA-CTERM sorting domain-containing protein [Sphingomonas piscis]|uniref:PEPxxWA-CTERM sorting domain-containing protein n=1 Tax=Sphingomonas piscis TaxID=2714943 RepID=UPI001FE54EA9|nr:PEPxxWA-CTERM sorting domain-containing protein [Sphingomonas piscis]